MGDKHRGTNDNIQALVSDTYCFIDCLTYSLLFFYKEIYIMYLLFCLLFSLHVSGGTRKSF